MTPLGAAVRGLLAGAAGTLAMDVLLYLRYRRGGGEQGFVPFESSASVHDWRNAPVPAQIGRRVVEGLLQRPLPDRLARPVGNLTHWTYGTVGGVPYGLVAGSTPRPRIAFGLPFGATVWMTGYLVLPPTGLYKPIEDYDRTTLAKDLTAHLVYGLTAATVFALLTPTRHRFRP
ncbi:DUF1440 domain-containing protein [Actinomadura rupiterrae]|uniref:DUF1440 domain-containing protein n=1 Tax=Actinomadura rupiterrae TaxID=559627 RepID=UPI0020A5B61E|nr:DUF1440 domain-containing protein [Actinomadura rupiterrae]MCP2342096.1 hypothetical protein [Actinomadura rupiterrae]